MLRTRITESGTKSKGEMALEVGAEVVDAVAIFVVLDDTGIGQWPLSG